jgi:hypothetical protein
MDMLPSQESDGGRPEVSAKAQPQVGSTSLAQAAARLIFVIRHAEKPDGEAEGVTILGERNEHSLIPRGWQRAGALARLFAPYRQEPFRPGLARPDQLYAPWYGSQKATENHRTSETIRPLSELIELKPNTQFKEKQEVALAHAVSEPTTAGVVLICWEHTRIVNAQHDDIAHNIVGLLNPTRLPKEWPDNRFDVVMSFLRKEGTSGYLFSEIPQMLLFKDSEAPL